MKSPLLFFSLLTLLSSLHSSVWAHLSDEMILIATQGEKPQLVDISKRPDDSNLDPTRVVILGYHDFSSTKEPTQMLIKTSSFRQQMQAIKDSNLKVISMEDFIAWKKGKKKIEDKSVVITIDDGWKTVYTEAYPVLKEFGYPFTVFLYTDYVDGGGAALTTPMIKEMQKNGCTVGSHSISHPYPSKVKKEKAKGEKSFTNYLQGELGESRKELREKFGTSVNSYAYPGGHFCDEMHPISEAIGYDCMFTVLPGKTTISTPNFTIPRYIVLGTHDYIFSNAITFKSTGGDMKETRHPVSPKPGEVIKNRLPLITADLSAVKNIDPESITMSLPGYAKVPAIYDPETKKLSWQVHRRIRSKSCEVKIHWKLLENKATQAPITWIFSIDQNALYQSTEPSP